MEEKKTYRRMPALLRTIDSINPEKDIRIRLTGRVIDKLTGSIMLDDGTGKAEIVVENADAVPDGFIRVFCRVLPLETGYELRAELVQDFSGTDIELYKKIRDLVNQ